MRLYMIRHGQTTGDIENRYGGRYDDLLTELGREQSAELSRRLMSAGIEKVFSSSLNRAKETADIVAEGIGADREIIDDFRECDRYGILSGMTKVEASAAHPEQVAKIKLLHETVTGAESYSDFMQRVIRAFQMLGTEKAGSAQTVALVTHGGVFRVLFREIMMLGEASIDDCALATLNHDESGFSVVELKGISILS